MITKEDQCFWVPELQKPIRTYENQYVWASGHQKTNNCAGKPGFWVKCAKTLEKTNKTNKSNTNMRKSLYCTKKTNKTNISRLLESPHPKYSPGSQKPSKHWFNWFFWYSTTILAHLNWFYWFYWFSLVFSARWIMVLSELVAQLYILKYNDSHPSHYSQWVQML